MNVSFAGASALEVIRMVRTNPSLKLMPVDDIDERDLMSFEGPHGSASSINYCALGLSAPPTKTHPAFIRVPRAAHRKRIETVRCLLFPKVLPRHALLQLDLASEPTLPATHDSSRRLGCRGTGSNSKASVPTTAPFDGHQVYVDSIPLACATIAASYQRLIRKGKMTEADAVARLVELIMEFTGHYSRDPANPRTGSVTENLAPLATVSDFQCFVNDSRHVKGIRLLSKALLYARDGSRSAMETCLWITLAFPEEYGLYGFTGCKLNAPLMLSCSQRALLRHKTLTPDLLWEAHHVAIEYQGYEDHATKTARAEDARRMNDYQVCGVIALFVTFDDVRTVAHCDKLARSIAAAIARSDKGGELRRIDTLLADPDARRKRARQLSLLLPPVNR